jgi:hypothetical protein
MHMLFAFSSQRTTIFGSYRSRKDEPHPLFAARCGCGF